MQALEKAVVAALKDIDLSNLELTNRVIQAAKEISGSEETVALDVTKVGNFTKGVMYKDSEGNLLFVKDDGTVYNGQEKDGKYYQGTQVGTDAKVENGELTFTATEGYDGPNEAGDLTWQNMTANISGTGGVAELEYIKDKIQTAISNISGVGTNGITARKGAERKWQV